MQNVYSLYCTLQERLAQLLTFLDRRNFITFIWMLIAAILSQSVALGSWNIVLPFDVNAASTIRRFSRWLHNHMQNGFMTSLSVALYEIGQEIGLYLPWIRQCCVKKPAL
jgi:hypothetical protein